MTRSSWLLTLRRYFLPVKRVWRVHDEPDAHGMVHVWPDEDVREHITEGLRPCWCGVKLETVGNCCIVTHSPASDGYK